MNMNDIIKTSFFDSSGYGSMKTTLADARDIDSGSQLDDVKPWFDNSIQQSKQVYGHKYFYHGKKNV